MAQVDSSAISDIEYDSKTKQLEVFFKKGGSHIYYQVPANVVKNFKRAASTGSYFNKNIRNNY